VVALLIFSLHRKNFIVVHIAPFLQLIALFGLVPLYTTSNTSESVKQLTENTIHFFTALTVNITFFFNRPY
jgi:hypothetical protein